MYTADSIFSIILTILVTGGLTYLILRFVNINTIKIMMLGIGLLLFSGLVLKDMVRYGFDEVLAVVGFGITIGGFIKRD